MVMQIKEPSFEELYNALKQEHMILQAKFVKEQTRSLAAEAEWIRYEDLYDNSQRELEDYKEYFQYNQKLLKIFKFFKGLKSYVRNPWSSKRKRNKSN